MTEEQKSAGKRFGFVALFAVLILGVLGGGLAVAGVAAHHMHGFGGWSGHHRMSGAMDEGDRMERMEHVHHMVGMLASRIDATSGQKQKLTAIADGIAKELEPYHQKFFEAHKRAHALLLQPTTDRAALEALRAEQMGLADEISKKIVQTLADAADVLTPEQRAKLAQGWDF